jgi:hypothetical protein
MSKKLFNSLLLFVAFFVCAQVATAQINMPAPSPSSTVQQKVGLIDVEINYSRPGKKGREIFGGLVPYGQMWRTGANASTKVTFSDKVTVEGNELAAGTYALYTIPGEKEWTIILSNNTELWGSMGYDKADDAARFTVPAEKLNRTVESFTINVTNLKDKSANIELAWENTAVAFGIETEVDAAVMADIQRKVINIEKNNAGLYHQAATYYFENNKDLDQALEWATKATEARPEAYWMAHLQAKILAAKKDYKQAIKIAERSKEAAQKANNPDYVKLNDQAISEWKKM